MLFEDTYRTIEKNAEGLFKDKGSKFLSFAFPVNNELEIKSNLAELKKEHFSASHHCYAYRLSPDKSIFRTNDDGEPSNTAGKPILGQIQSFDLTNVLIVVVRYFGGTLLGVSGLINAYKEAAADAIKNSKIVEKTVQEIYELEFEFPAMNDVMKILKESESSILHQDFQLSCKLQFSIRRSNADMVFNKLKKVVISINFIKIN